MMPTPSTCHRPWRQFARSASTLSRCQRRARPTITPTALRSTSTPTKTMKTDWALEPGALAAALGLAVAASYFAPSLPSRQLAGMAMAAVAIWLAGLDTYKKGLVALRRRRLNINALMSVAVTGAFVLGQWPEAAMVMALYAIAELIEARSVDRARNAIKGSMALAPDAAETRQADGSWQSIPANSIAIGSVVRIRPGGRVPLAAW